MPSPRAGADQAGRVARHPHAPVAARRPSWLPAGPRDVEALPLDGARLYKPMPERSACWSVRLCNIHACFLHMHVRWLRGQQGQQLDQLMAGAVMAIRRACRVGAGDLPISRATVIRPPRHVVLLPGCTNAAAVALWKPQQPGAGCHRSCQGSAASLMMCPQEPPKGRQRGQGPCSSGGSVTAAAVGAAAGEGGLQGARWLVE